MSSWEEILGSRTPMSELIIKRDGLQQSLNLINFEIERQLRTPEYNPVKFVHAETVKR